MNRIMMLAVTVVALLLAPACAVLDGDDRDDLESAIEKAPPEDRDAMAAMIVGAKTRNYLQSRPPNSAAVSMECRMVHPTKGPGAWSFPAGGFAKPADILACLRAGHTYPLCLQFVSDLLAERALNGWNDFKKTLSDSDPRKATDLECRAVVNPGFSAAEVPGAGDDLSRVTAGAMVEWLLTLPAPPPGLSPATWRALGPLLCALDVAWGCAPGLGGGITITITPAPSGGSGDYP